MTFFTTHDIIKSEGKIMKKALYFILLAVEFLVSFYILVMAAGWFGWSFFCVITAIWAALMGWQLVKLKKAEEEKAKRNAKIFMVLIMSLPAVAAVGAILWIGHIYF